MNDDEWRHGFIRINIRSVYFPSSMPYGIVWLCPAKNKNEEKCNDLLIYVNPWKYET